MRFRFVEENTGPISVPIGCAMLSASAHVDYALSSAAPPAADSGRTW
jgi:hypothetical protein